MIIPKFSETWRYITATFMVVVFFCGLAVYWNLFIWPEAIPLYWVILAGMLSFSLLVMDGKRIGFLSTPLFLWIIVFLTVTVIWYLAEGLDVHILKTRILSCVLMVVFLMLFHADRRLINLVRWMLLVAVVLAIINNVIDFMIPYTFVPRGTPWTNPGRSAGFYVNANEAGAAILLGFVLSFELLSQKWRVAFAVASLFGVVLTFSRSAILGWFLVMFVLWYGGQIKGHRLAVLLTPIGVVAALFWTVIMTFIVENNEINSANVLGRIQWFLSPDKNVTFSTESRLQVLKKAWAMFLDHPIIGNGVGSTDVWSYSVSAHNMYLVYMADYGILGLFLFLTLVLAVVHGVRDSARITGLTFAVLILYWGFFSHNIVDNYFALFALTLMASITALSTKSEISATGDSEMRRSG
jgi:O-antigen ligase